MKKILIIFISLFALSCDSFLEEKIHTTVTTDNFYKNEADMEAALGAAYSAFQEKNYYDNFIFQVADLVTDILYTRYNNNVYDKANVAKDHTQYRNFWKSCWAANNAINSVICYAPKAEMSKEALDRIVGEACFLRALNYFNLVRIYGSVPLVLEVVDKYNPAVLYPATAPRDDVYDQIIADLIYAEAVLPETNIGRATVGAAKTLLAKVYLTRAGYWKMESDPETLEKGDPVNYQLALDKLNEVIESGTYDLFEDYGDVFSNDTENGIEHIFSIQFKQGVLGGGAIAGEGSLKQTHWAPQGFGVTQYAYDTYRSSAAFYKKFAAEDKRRAVTFLDYFIDKDGIERIFKADGSGNMKNLHSRKYIRDINAAGQGTFTTAAANDGEENTIVLRYADVLLMHSEAAYGLSNSVGESELWGVNEVRLRAGLDALKPADVVDFTTTLLDERDKELCFEGHGWFDYVRTGQLNARASKTVKTVNKFYYWPIPSMEISKNENLQQSLGW